MTNDGSSEASELSKPVAFASYELLGKLARGGMGTVYVARRAGAAGFQRLFAVKLMHDHLADHEEFIQMFLDEARLAARLHHPNVVAILDTGEIEGRQFVVMDYVEGCSLQQLLKLSPDNRPLRSVVSIFNDFLMGLHAAHELRGDDGQLLNLVHRDVSPQNILIGVDGVARITDFGIAKAEARLTSTRPGLRKGKLAFMSPEQLYDEGIDRRADLFSAGAMLWSTLTGEKLFAGSSDAATMRNLLQMDVQPPSEVGLKPPAYFDEICLKALAKKPEDRFQTAAEFADALRAAAMEHKVFGTSADVSSWLRVVAGDKLDERRKALGSTASDSSIHSMPVLVESPSSFGRSLTTGSKMQRRAKKKKNMVVLALIAVPLAIVTAVLLAVLTRPTGEVQDERDTATARTERTPELGTGSPASAGSPTGTAGSPTGAAGSPTGAAGSPTGTPSNGASATDTPSDPPSDTPAAQPRGNTPAASSSAARQPRVDPRRRVRRRTVVEAVAPPSPPPPGPAAAPEAPEPPPPPPPPAAAPVEQLENNPYSGAGR